MLIHIVLVAVLGALTAPARAALATVYSSCNQPNTVALTFDDGPYIYQAQVAQTLSDAGIRGTFFVNGNNWACIYDQDMVSNIQTTYRLGHEFGSHTWHHYDLTTLSWDKIHDEMWRTELALQRIIGVNPAIMRPPYGNYNDLVRAAAFIRNQSLILWDFDSGDSTGSTAQQSQQAYEALANQRPDNILTLNHETYQSTVDEVLPFAINVLKSKGYRFATVSECLSIPAYQWVRSPQTPTADWNCNV